MLVDYSQLVDEAMHTIVFKVLTMVSENGLIGDQHFYLSFMTQMKEVILSNELKHKYPEEMTIIIQHQFKKLKTYNDRLEIVLSFSGEEEKLVIPFTAITAFLDPSANFGLKFKKPYEIMAKIQDNKADHNQQQDEVINIAQYLNK